MLYHIMADDQVELMPEFLQQEHIGGDETPFCSVLLEKTSLRPLSVPLPYPRPLHRSPCVRKAGGFHRPRSLSPTLSCLSLPACTA